MSGKSFFANATNQLAAATTPPQLDSFKRSLMAELPHPDSKKIADIHRNGKDTDGLPQSSEVARIIQAFNKKVDDHPKLNPTLNAPLKQELRIRALEAVQKRLAATRELRKEQHDNAFELPAVDAADALGNARPPTTPHYTAAQKESRDRLMVIANHAQSFENQIATTLRDPKNAHPSIAPNLTDEFNQALMALSMSDAVEALATEYAHCALLTNPNHEAHIRKTDAALNTLKKLPPSSNTDLVAQKKQINEILQDLSATADPESAALKAFQERFGGLVNAVPSFNPNRDTYFAKEGKPIPPAFQTVYNQLNQLLVRIQNAAAKIHEIATQLSSAALTAAEITSQIQELSQHQDIIKEAAKNYNEFLIAQSSNRWDEHGLSLLSSVLQDKLQELTAFAAAALNSTQATASRVKKHQPTFNDFLECLYNPITKPISKLWETVAKAWDNRDVFTIAGAGNKYNLESDPRILDLFGKECTTSSTIGTWLNKWTEAEKLKDDDGQDVVLPVYGVNSKDPQDQKFSVIALAREVFPNNPEKHIVPSKNGSVVTIMWDNKDEKEKWLKALKTRNKEYLAWKDKSNKVEAKLALPTEPQQAQATLSLGQAAPIRPGFTRSPRPPLQPTVTAPQQLTLQQLASQQPALQQLASQQLAPQQPVTSDAAASAQTPRA